LNFRAYQILLEAKAFRSKLAHVAMKECDRHAKQLIKDLTLNTTSSARRTSRRMLENHHPPKWLKWPANNLMNKGKIVQIIGPVLDIEFADKLPAIYNALTVEYDMPGSGRTKLTLEVQQHLGDNWVRAVAMSTTEGLKRGMEITDTGAPISMPVGEAVMGASSMSPANPWTSKVP